MKPTTRIKALFWAAGVLFAAVAIFPLLYSQNRNPQPSALTMPKASSFRISMGVGDREPSTWDGSVRLSSGQVTSIAGLQLGDNDTIDGLSGWKLSTRRSNPTAMARPKGQSDSPIQENGVIVSICGADPNTGVLIRTANGEFSFKPGDVAYGKPTTELGGRVRIERVPNMLELTESREDQDFPAVADA